MRLKDAFNIIEEMDKDRTFNKIIIQKINVWPLLRHAFWTNLNQISTKRENLGIGYSLKNFASRISTKIIFFPFVLLTKKYEIKKIFISNPVHLQKDNSGIFFDKIVDPIITLSENIDEIEKFYLSFYDNRKKLRYQGQVLRPLRIKKVKQIECEELFQVAAVKLNVHEAILKMHFHSNLSVFFEWFELGKKLFKQRPNLEQVFVVGWYTPQMMGLIAAAKRFNVESIDIQHGKQGKYQAMYSGWNLNSINLGYDILPDYFWVWGKPSRNHIAQNLHREKHLPFVGGNLLPNYLKNEKPASKVPLNKKIRVLFTMQPAQGENFEPIPDFIIDFLNGNPADVVFLFRKHPNDPYAQKYYEKRLKDVPASLHKFDNASENVIVTLKNITHHVTAYSSCCYEAELFGIETFLFGWDAFDIYEDDINSGVFTWSEGLVRDFKNWLDSDRVKMPPKASGYIESSPIIAKRLLCSPSVKKTNK